MTAQPTSDFNHAGFIGWMKVQREINLSIEALLQERQYCEERHPEQIELSKSILEIAKYITKPEDLKTVTLLLSACVAYFQNIENLNIEGEDLLQKSHNAGLEYAEETARNILVAGHILGYKNLPVNVKRVTPKEDGSPWNYYSIRIE